MSYKHKDRNSQLKEKNHKQPHWFQLFAFSFQLANQRGNVAVITALCLSVLIGMLAFVLDTGYLYREKNRFQNAVEAAAMAGALNLCDDDFIAVSRKIAEENDIPFDEECLEVQVGFYDESDEYDDFSIYKDFVAQGAEDYPDDEYDNAVMVMINKDVSTLTSDLVGKDEVAVGAAAVAYLKRYGFLALGDNGFAYGISSWENGFPTFRNEPIHSNSDIEFYGTETFEGNSGVSAVGAITGLSIGRGGVEPVNIPPIDWEDLKEKATENGDVYYPEDWESGQENGDSYGNTYTKESSSPLRFSFLPSDGNHDGRTYYFAFHDKDAHSPPDMEMIISFEAGRTFCNFTMATEGTIRIRTTFGGYVSDPMHLGGTGDDMGYMYSAGEIYYQDRGDSVPIYISDGVVYRTEDIFTMYTYSSDYTTYSEHKMRVIANEIRLIGRLGWPGKIIFDGLFAPPCPPNIVRLGRLKLSGAE